MLKSLGIALLLVAMGAVIVYIGIYEPYMQMSRGEDGVSFSNKMQFFGPFVTVAAAVLLIGTPFSGPAGVMHPWAQLQGRGKVILVVALIAGVAAGAYVAFDWFPTEAAKFGYVRG
ncbi:hypothetical protein sos41_37720 [Alphaproteobacteria bacterium SO-S41]|nr:hypothetical protein sos41_37720 [Alphaproteobacteria bacterium SO-S41]